MKHFEKQEKVKNIKKIKIVDFIIEAGSKGIIIQPLLMISSYKVDFEIKKNVIVLADDLEKQ